ncbi:MAG: LD-carboxypeptidase [Spirochaetota bacterium]
MKRVKPRALKSGDRIGLIAPSGSAIAPERIDFAMEAIRELGFKAVEGRSCRSVYGYLAGSDETRAADMNDFFGDEAIDGIFCLKGGYGTPRILDRLDFARIRANPKVFVGYSDITGTHLALGRECGLVTFHGPMPYTEKLAAWDDATRASLLAAIGSQGGKGRFANPAGRAIQTLTGGKARGRLVGGNLSLIAATMGTPWEIDTRGCILFIEDINERPYRIDRMLTQLRLAGKLDDALGFVLGDWCDCGAEEGKRSLSVDEVLRDLIASTGKPAISNLGVGHCRPNLTLPLGVEVEIDGDGPSLDILESATT